VKSAGEPAGLCDTLCEQFEWRVTHDGMIYNSPRPASQWSCESNSFETAPHGFAERIQRDGARSLAEKIIKRIPLALWGEGRLPRKERSETVARRRALSLSRYAMQAEFLGSSGMTSFQDIGAAQGQPHR